MVPPQPRDGAPEERELVERLRAGDERAFEALVREYGPRLLATARRILGNEEDARDAVQEALLSAFRSIGDFQEKAQISTWLHRIAVNAALMRLRRRGRRPEREIEDLLPRFTPGEHFAEPPARWQEAADEPILREETRELVRSSIERLPDTYRAALLLRDIEGLSNEEVAAALGVSPNAAKIRVHRARQALRQLLDPHLREVRP